MKKNMSLISLALERFGMRFFFFCGSTVDGAASKFGTVPRRAHSHGSAARDCFPRQQKSSSHSRRMAPLLSFCSGIFQAAGVEHLWFLSRLMTHHCRPHNIWISVMQVRFTHKAHFTLFVNPSIRPSGDTATRSYSDRTRTNSEERVRPSLWPRPVANFCFPLGGTRDCHVHHTRTRTRCFLSVHHHTRWKRERGLFFFTAALQHSGTPN